MYRDQKKVEKKFKEKKKLKITDNKPYSIVLIWLYFEVSINYKY
jgi:hypothetical protein